MLKENIFNQVNQILLNDIQPSNSIKNLIKEGKFNQYPFDMIKKLENIKQNVKYHPEGNVLNHVFLVIDKASEFKDYSSEKNIFTWACFLHDIGKLTTTKIRNGRITSYNHDIEGEKIGQNFLNIVNSNKIFNKKVSKLIRYHMQPLFYDKNLKFFDPQNMLNDVEYKEVALLSLCDRLGRGKLTDEIINLEKEKIQRFKEYCQKFKS